MKNFEVLRYCKYRKEKAVLTKDIEYNYSIQLYFAYVFNVNLFKINFFIIDCVDAKTLIQDNISIKQIVDRVLTLFGILKEKVKSDKHRDLSRCSSAADIDVTDGIPESISSAESTPETSLNEASLENKIDFIKQNPSIEAIKPTPANLKKSIIIPRLKHSGKKKKKRIGKSDRYFVALFWVFAISRVWMNLWILPIIPFFILFYVAKNAFIKLELAQFFMERLKEQDVSNRFLAREDVIVPSPIKTLLIMLRLGDRKARLFYCYLVSGLEK